MDDIVKAALAKWPHVAHCYGWLALDSRGDWYLRDDRVRAAGAFPAVKGDRLRHARLREFIGRNYLPDARGCWYFQNGPQRVYVELEATPWVWRVQPGQAAVVSHTGCAAAVTSAWLDELGRLYLDTPIGIGIVHSLDMDAAADALERADWPAPAGVLAAALPDCFGFSRKPEPGC